MSECNRPITDNRRHPGQPCPSRRPIVAGVSPSALVLLAVLVVPLALVWLACPAMIGNADAAPDRHACDVACGGGGSGGTSNGNGSSLCAGGCPIISGPLPIFGGTSTGTGDGGSPSGTGAGAGSGSGDAGTSGDGGGTPGAAGPIPGGSDSGAQSTQSNEHDQPPAVENQPAPPPLEPAQPGPAPAAPAPAPAPAPPTTPGPPVTAADQPDSSSSTVPQPPVDTGLVGSHPSSTEILLGHAVGPRAVGPQASPYVDRASAATTGITPDRPAAVRISAYATQIGSGTQALAIIFIVLVIGVWLLGHRIGQAVSEEKS